MDGEEETFLDVNKRIWKKDGIPPYEIQNIDRPYGILVFLPFHTLPMWPAKVVNHVMDMYWCVCAICNRFTNYVAQVLIDFDYPCWSVRVACIACRPLLLTQTSLTPNIMMISELVNPLIIAAFKGWPRCDMCSREEGCITRDLCDATRKLIRDIEGPDYEESLEGFDVLYRAHETRALLNYFFSVQLDICTPLRYKMCHRIGCGQMRDRVVNCPNCRRMSYCSYWCKKHDENVHRPHCISFYSIWHVTF